MTYPLQDLIDIPKLQQMLDNLYHAFNCASAIIDNESNVLTASAWQDVCKDFHRVHPVSERECRESDRYIHGHLHEARPSVIYRCPHGLVDAATPIIIEGNHLGNVFIGQLLLEKPDIEAFRAQAQQYGYDETAYLEALSRVPVLTLDQLEQNLIFVRHFTELLGELGLKRLKELEQEKLLRRLNEDLEKRVLERTAQLEKSNQDLKDAIAKVRLLSGLLPICASCKKIKDDRGYWNQIETYVSEHSEAEFSHGLCPECAKKLYPKFY